MITSHKIKWVEKLQNKIANFMLSINKSSHVARIDLIAYTTL